MTQLISSPVRWTGASSAISPWVISQFCDHHTYVEPFGGGAAVLLRKPRSRVEVYNDLDQRLRLIFTVLRDPKKAAALKRSLKLTPYSEAEYHEAWEPESNCDEIERARRTIVALRCGFGGNASAEKSGFAFGKSSNPATQFRSFVDHLDGVIERLRSVQILCRDALDLIQRCDGAETLFYIDPPALGRPGEYVHELSHTQHEQLLDLLLRVRGKVVLTSYANQLYHRRLSSWTQLKRRVSLRASPTKTITRAQVLWRNF